LLADREAAQDWSAVISYGQEVLEMMASVPTSSYQTYLLPGKWATRVDKAIVRTQMARAYEAIGNPVNAFAVYRPVFDDTPNFDRYAEARRLAELIEPQRAQAFTDEVLAGLHKGLPRGLYLICQIYLSEGDFDLAYRLVENTTDYHALNAIKLIATAHLLVGLGPKATSKMGRRLREIYAKIDEADKEPVRFLRERRPVSQELPRATAIARAETLYRQLMQMHINNGRKTYATAAYYCGLLGEIAAHEDRLPAFVQFYDDLLRRYARHRALRAELEAEVRPLLKGGLE
jgi:tetratricopeptide (TPR) repeat protein